MWNDENLLEKVFFSPFSGQGAGGLVTVLSGLPSLLAVVEVAAVLAGMAVSDGGDAEVR